MTQPTPMTAGGSIVTTYAGLPSPIRTTGSPPLAARHRAEVIRNFGTTPLNPQAPPSEPIYTSWYSNGGPQLLEVIHSPPSQHVEAWQSEWTQRFDNDTAAQVPV